MKFIDLFAGIGGIRLAFEEHGECVFSSEWNANSQKIYVANFGKRPHGNSLKSRSDYRI